MTAHARSAPSRRTALILSIVSACAFIGVMTFTLNDRAAAMLLDRGGMFPYPLTIQNTMIVLFAVGIGEAFVRWTVAQREMRFATMGLLPEDGATVLQASELGPLRQKVSGIFDEEHGFLPYLIDICILQFHSSKSVDQTVSVLNSSLELISHRVDLRYTTLRYITWVIPTLGFIGTVVGISATLDAADFENLGNMSVLTARLSVAFDTTLVALCLSAILVYLHQFVQSVEERSVNLAGNYCLRNLINRLYVAR